VAPDSNRQTDAAPFSARAHGDEPEPHAFLLLVSGTTARSARAIVNARQFCEAHLRGCYELEVIDISIRPEVAKAEQIVAAPTLIRLKPAPRRLFVGDLSDPARLLAMLGLPPLAAPAPTGAPPAETL
jgi:circadian clock protein KaiB